MTEVTKTEISCSPIVSNLLNGTARKRVKIYIRCTSAGTSNTLDLSTYVPNLQGIATKDTLAYADLDGARNGTANTVSGTTITYAGHAGSGVWNQECTGYF